MHIYITDLVSAQAQIDASREGDLITFEGLFHLDAPLIFWTNRDYNGSGSVFLRHDKEGYALSLQPRPGEPNDAIPHWLQSIPCSWIPWSLRLWFARRVLRLNIARGGFVMHFMVMPETAWRTTPSEL